MSIAELIARAVKAYGFRSRGLLEGREQYLAALIAYVEARDYAMAHELRIGRLQADWTPEDVNGFLRHLKDKPRSTHDAATAPPVVEALDAGIYDTTEASLLSIARKWIEVFQEKRQDSPTADIHPIASVLMTDGHLLVAPVARGTRIATLKRLAQTQPVFGFALGFDAFVHAITEGQTATKTDALLVHVGTRDMRWMLTQRYYVDHGRVRFDPVQETDKRDTAITLDDPYADIFVLPQSNRSTVQ